MDKKRYTTITIPSPLANKLKERIEGTGFHSLSSYVCYILRQVLAHSSSPKSGEALSPQEEEKIKENLRSLGYVD